MDGLILVNMRPQTDRFSHGWPHPGQHAATDRQSLAWMASSWSTCGHRQTDSHMDGLILVNMRPQTDRVSHGWPHPGQHAATDRQILTWMASSWSTCSHRQTDSHMDGLILVNISHGWPHPGQHA